MHSKEEMISRTVEFVKKTLEGDTSGHDWQHIERVWKNAVHIAKKEDADLFIVELAALLHDIADWKFNNGDDSTGPKVAGEWLESLGTDEQVVSHVCEIIKEGMIVQDADRLDALGAIGIARVFAYGGNKGIELYNPEIKPKMLLKLVTKISQYTFYHTGKTKVFISLIL